MKKTSYRGLRGAEIDHKFFAVKAANEAIRRLHNNKCTGALFSAGVAAGHAAYADLATKITVEDAVADVKHGCEGVRKRSRRR